MNVGRSVLPLPRLPWDSRLLIATKRCERDRMLGEGWGLFKAARIGKLLKGFLINVFMVSFSLFWLNVRVCMCVCLILRGGVVITNQS